MSEGKEGGNALRRDMNTQVRERGRGKERGREGGREGEEEGGREGGKHRGEKGESETVKDKRNDGDRRERRCK